MPSGNTHRHVTNLSGNEIYCLNRLSFTPGNICIGNSVFALGILGSLTAGLNILVGGEIPDVTSLIHDGRLNAINRMMAEAKAAREKALDRIQIDARRHGADDVVGVKIHVYELGGGLIEFLAIGTAVRKMEGIGTRTAALIPQAIIRDRDTFFEKPPQSGRAVSLTESGKSSAAATQGGPVAILIAIVMFVFYVLVFVLKRQ